MNNKRDIKVSVIVPIYNSSKYLKKCIDSILSQSYKNFELLLINDGSTDSSGFICRQYYDNRIRYFEQINQGVSCARNVGIKESRGDYITFVDSDDILDEKYLTNLVQLQKKFNSDITICTFISIDNSGNKTDDYSSEWRTNKYIRGDRAKTELTDKVLSNEGDKRPVMSPYCKLYRKDIVKNNNILFDESLPIGEDALFNLEYAQYIHSLCFLKKILYLRTIRKGSAVMSCRPEIYKELKRLFCKYFEIKKRYNINSRMEKSFLFNKVNDSLGLFVFRSKSVSELCKRAGQLYRFIGSEPVGDVWRRINVRDIPGKKNKIKLLLINYRMVGLWSLIKKIDKERENVKK